MAFQFNKDVKGGLGGSDGTGFWGSPQDPYYADLANAPREQGFAAQQKALHMYGMAARGQGPSVAQNQLRQQSEENYRQGMSLQGMARGGNIAQTTQQASGAFAGAQSQLSQQAAVLRAQETQAAQQNYAQLASQMYGQGFGYDQLASQQGLGYLGLQNQWKLGQRGLDQQREQYDKNFALGMYNGIIGAVGGVGGAAASAG
jgi:hypothetical protein